MEGPGEFCGRGSNEVSETPILGRGRAPGKVILFGEHAVVYGRPALAVPVTQVAAEAVVQVGPAGSGLVIHAADLGETIALRTAAPDHPLAAAVRLALAVTMGHEPGVSDQESASSFQFPVSSFQLPASEPDWRITVRSTIPVASGLGSGAAVSAAIVRAVAEAGIRGQGSGVRSQRIGESAKHATEYAIRNTEYEVTPANLSTLVYEIERLHHGTPSGIDNTVIAYGQPVYFVRGQPPQPFAIGRPFTLVIADTGIRSPTRIPVGDVRAAWQRETARCEALFDKVAGIVEAARSAIAAGAPDALGPLMDANHALLQEMGVSCRELDTLVAAARAAGALGAKLSGAGRGGNTIALVTEATAARVAQALLAAGAAGVIVTQVGMTADR